MSINSQPTSHQLRSLQRRLREATEGGREMTADQAQRFVTLLGDCAGDVEQLELATGTASLTSRLKAAGGDVGALRAELALATASKAVRHG